MIGFIIGLFVGGIIGVVVMCCCFIASNADGEMIRMESEPSRKKEDS